MRELGRTSFSGLLVLILVSCAVPPEADIILTAQGVYTLEESKPVAEAIAIEGDRILAVGSIEDVQQYRAEATRVESYPNSVIVPGFIDAHGHILEYASSLQTLDLRGTQSYQEVIDRVAHRVKQLKPGEWIVGSGWDQNDWEISIFPTHHRLSDISPENPVWLVRIGGHTGLANARAMEIAGISVATPDANGGVIIRNPETREPTGIFLDLATQLITGRIPKASPHEKRALLEHAIDQLVAAGLTTVHDAGTDLETLSLLHEMAEAGALRIRVYSLLNFPGLVEYMQQHPPIPHLADHRFSARGIKLVADGAMGSRGAALLEEYSDESGSRGILRMTEEEVFETTRTALRHNYQVATHAIGDAANTLVLNAYERALGNGASQDPRLRIEHAQVVTMSDVRRFVQLQVIPSMQPTHATSDMYWAESRLGPHRIHRAYAWRHFIEAGAPIVSGSDFPVESVSPLEGVYAAITRQNLEQWPEGGWYAEQRLSRVEALKSFTRWAAYAEFHEEIKGSIAPGKLADLVVLNGDILSLPPRAIPDLQVVATLVGGKVVYERRSSRVASDHAGKRNRGRRVVLHP